MTFSDINTISEAMVAHLKANGVGGTDGVVGFYANETTPISELPESFIEVVPNGALSTSLSEFGIVSGAVLLILHIRLSGTGQANTLRETFLLDRIKKAVEKPFVRNHCHFELDKGKLVYAGRNLYSGYSSKTLSFNVKIY